MKQKGRRADFLSEDELFVFELHLALLRSSQERLTRPPHRRFSKRPRDISNSFSTSYLGGQGVILDEIVSAYPSKLADAQLRRQQEAELRAQRVEESEKHRKEWNTAMKATSKAAE